MNVDLTSTLKDGRNLLNTWKNRYSAAEYPHKVVLNLFYRKFTIEKMWSSVINQSYPTWQRAYEANMFKYSQVAQMEIVPVLENWIQSNRQVGMVKYSDFQSYIQNGARGNAEAIKGIDYTYLLHRVLDELIVLWISMVNSGDTQVNAIAKLTGVVIEIPSIRSYAEIESVFDQLGAEQYLQTFLLKGANNNKTSLSNLEVVSIINRIQSCKNLTALDVPYQDFKDSDHPGIYHALGVRFLILKNKERAKEMFIKGSLFGAEYPSIYYDNLFIDSIGQCLTYLMTHFKINNCRKVVSITALAYVYLSRCIELHPQQAHDSYRTRAILLNDHENKREVENLFEDIFNLNVNFEALFISDFYVASTINNDPEDLNKAKKIYQFVLDNVWLFKPSFESTIEKGKNQHLIAYKKLESAYKNKKLSFTINDLLAIE